MDQNFHYRDSLRKQIKESLGRLLYTYTSHTKKMNSLTKCYNKIKLAQIIISAIATGGFLGAIITDDKFFIILGGLCSTILLILNLYIKDMELVEEIKKHRNASDELWMLKEDYLSLLTDLPTLTNVEIVGKRDDLQKRTFEVYKIAPKTDRKSYFRARNALKNEEEQYFESEELDKMLPEHLREKQ